MVASRQNTLSSLLRDAWVEIDLAAIEQNVQIIRSWLQGKNGQKSQLMAVVKSDAYGHGANRVAEILVANGADWLGVASVDEGRQLRETDPETPILILGPSPFWAIESALASKLDITVTSMNQIEALENAARKANKIANLHLKVDTGMHRLGISKFQVDEALNKILAAKPLKLKSVFSHLAMAKDHEAVEFQHKQFRQVLKQLKERDLKVPCHLASSEATENFPDTHYDMVRIGIYLYGLRPKHASNDLVPAMSVKGRVMSIVEVPEGESAGYNWTWTAKRKSRLASIPIGYADGVDRSLSNKIEASLMGKPIKQVGLISMDQMLLDVTDVPEASEGDVITLIGRDEQSPDNVLSLHTWANELDTITYELACRLRTRLPKIYTRNWVKDEKLQNDLKAYKG